VEVAAPSQTEEDLAAKVRLYLSGGTRLVWIVWPHDRSIDIWRAGTLDAPALRLGNHDILSGEDVVAGFTHPVADIFA
jgi:Uma2 family endonuclease